MFSSNTNNNSNSNNPNNDTLVEGSPNASISCVKWSPTNPIFCATAWDGSVTCFNNKAVKQTKVQAPVLCCDWKKDGSQILFGACDKNAYLWDLGSGQHKQVAQHAASIKCSRFIDQNVFVTGSWDRTIKYWDLSKNPGQPVVTVNCPERIYCMDVKDCMLVAACADQKIRVYDIRNPSNVAQEITTTLKHQFRCVALFPDSAGFAVGSIEGRVMIHTYGNASKTFAYKCHRDDNCIYAVHAIKFHQAGTFFTAGADGGVLFWDKDQKQKLKTLQKVGAPIVDADFNSDFNYLVYAASYDWGQGVQGSNNLQGSQLYIHAIQSDEVQRLKKN